ncbi:repulsive guidance molecule A-like [Lycorma delicatula]|uniref:repulsive guidance molecule A-like n=1 Tax=Lycorma delicatula TaxID=130591 RepID=UPI003F51950D
MELALPLLTALLLMIASCGGCRVDQCTRSYNSALDEEGLSGPVASPEYCHILQTYGACIKQTARKCIGNLRYHTVKSVLIPMNQRYNCSQQGKPLPRPVPKPATEQPPPPPPVPACTTFNGRHAFRHCGLFGDPHLKTFNNEYQTCRVQGAWPLIDNSYLAVQVTNEPVFDGSPATATTKVTVIVKGRNTPCTTEKTYEATADSPLPATFIDGTYISDSILIAASAETQPERVEIYIRYIETTIVIRRVVTSDLEDPY